MFSTFTAVIIFAQYFHLEYNSNGYCGEHKNTTLSVVGNFISVVVGNESESFASNRVENVTLAIGEYNVSLENVREYNFTFTIEYRVTAGTSTAGISFLANENTTKIFAHPQSELILYASSLLLVMTCVCLNTFSI